MNSDLKKLLKLIKFFKKDLSRDLDFCLEIHQSA